MRRLIPAMLIFVTAAGSTVCAGELERETSRLLKRLKTATGTEHKKILTRLADIGPEARKAIPALIALWDDHRNYPGEFFSSTRSQEAAYAVGRIGIEAIPTIKKLLRDGNPKLRFWALTVVANFDHLRPEVRDVLVSMLKTKDVNVAGTSLHREIISVLNQSANIPMDLVPFLVKCLKRDDGFRAARARRDLETYPSIASDAADALYELGRKAEAALPTLSWAATKHPDPYVRLRSMLALGKIDTSRKFAIPALVKGLEDEGFVGLQWPSQLKFDAACELRRFAPRATAAVPVIVKLLRTDASRKHVHYYGTLTEILSHIRPVARDAIPILRKDLQRTAGLGGKDKKIRKGPYDEIMRRVYAACALALMTDKNRDAVDLLISVVKDDRWDTETEAIAFGVPISPRDVAVNGLAELGPKAKRALPALRKLLKRDGRNEEVVWSLLCIDPEYRVPREFAYLVTDKLKALAPDEAAKLLSTRAKACVPGILDNESSAPRGEFEFWVDVLSRVKPDPLPAFVKHAADARNDELLLYLGKRAAPAITSLVKRLKDTTRKKPFLEKRFSADNRAQAGRTLGRLTLAPKTVVPALAAALRDNRVVVRYEAAVAIGRFGPQAKPAMKALQQAARDRYASVRTAARAAIARVSAAGK